MLSHLFHYGILLVIVFIVFLSRSFFSFDNNLLIEILYIPVFIYVVVWGIIHHYLEHDLTPKIVVEYMLIAGISILIATIAINGGL